MINIEKCKDEILNNNFKVSLDSRLVSKGWKTTPNKNIFSSIYE